MAILDLSQDRYLNMLTEMLRMKKSAYEGIGEGIGGIVQRTDKERDKEELKKTLERTIPQKQPETVAPAQPAQTEIDNMGNLKNVLGMGAQQPSQGTDFLARPAEAPMRPAEEAKPKPQPSRFGGLSKKSLEAIVAGQYGTDLNTGPLEVAARRMAREDWTPEQIKEWLASYKKSGTGSSAYERMEERASELYDSLVRQGKNREAAEFMLEWRRSTGNPMQGVLKPTGEILDSVFGSPSPKSGGVGLTPTQQAEFERLKKENPGASPAELIDHIRKNYR